MKRDRQSNLERLIGELPDAGDQPARRDGHMSGSQADAPWRVQDPDGPHEIVIVGEWLAHAHEDDVVDFLSGQFFYGEKLCDDLAGCEVALQSVESARAKFASVGAADLARNAERPAIGPLSVERGRRGNEHRFDHLPVLQAKQELPRRILRSCLLDLRQRRERKALRKGCAQTRGHIRHLFE